MTTLDNLPVGKEGYIKAVKELEEELYKVG